MERIGGDRVASAAAAYSQAVIEYATWLEERNRQFESKPKELEELEGLETRALLKHLEGLEGKIVEEIVDSDKTLSPTPCSTESAEPY